MSATISSGYPRTLLDFAVSKGADRQTLLDRSGIDPAAVAGYDNRVPIDQYLALFDAAAEMTGEPGIALQFGKAVRMQEISIVGLICEACEVTVDVGPQLNRYARLVLDEGRAGDTELMRGVVDERGLWIEGPSKAFVRHRYLAEAELARLVWNIRVMFAGTEFLRTRQFPRAMQFTHGEPNYRDEYERIFGCPIEFNAVRNALLTDPEFRTLRQPPTNRYVFGVLSEKADAMLKDLQASSTVRGKLEAMLMPILHTEEIGMDAIAAKMGLSRQTLFRRLKSEDVTFEKVLDELRHKMAVHYLESRKVSVGETAYLVGFSDRAAFSRAFKRWTGQSPGRRAD